MEHEWLQERRKLFIKNIVKDFFECAAFFKDLKEHTHRYGVRYDGFDFWVGTDTKKGKLWLLKDLCHLIWGHGCEEESTYGIMLDWMVGAIFHEAMKLKENAYMIECYSTTFLNRAAEDLNSGRAAIMKDLFHDMSKEIHRSIERIDWLFSHAEEYLFKVMKRERANHLLVRYLLNALREKEGWQNGKGPKKLLEHLFPDGLDKAFCIAGESYLEGGWLTEAKEAFQTALEINSQCLEAVSGLRLLEKRIQEIASVLNHN